MKAKTILILNSVLTKAVYALYPLLLIYLAVYHLTDKEPGFVPALLVPGISFVLVSIFRNWYDAPRPYEIPGAKPPLIKKDAPGKSFPSRHIFSIFVIAVTFFWVWPVPGILIGIAGILLAWSRVAGGVHFPRDVIAGALIGVFSGVIGYYVILPLL
jgi:membrane-associated phospholipid phosphatase